PSAVTTDWVLLIYSGLQSDLNFKGSFGKGDCTFHSLELFQRLSKIWGKKLKIIRAKNRLPKGVTEDHYAVIIDLDTKVWLLDPSQNLEFILSKEAPFRSPSKKRAALTPDKVIR